MVDSTSTLLYGTSTVPWIMLDYVRFNTYLYYPWQYRTRTLDSI